MPITLSRETIYSALDVVSDENLTHFDVRCPRCRKTNRISADQLRHAAPQWERNRDEETASSE